MTATLGSFPVFRAFDDNGAPLVGGFLHSYAAGTLTPLATYTDQGGGTQNTNPVQLDSTGSANVWFGSSAYKLVLKTSTGSTLWTVDQYQPESAAATLRSDLASTASTALGDALVGVKSTLTGGVPRTQHDKNADTVSVKDFGAKGDSTGVTGNGTDDTAAIIAAIAVSGQKTLFFPPGIYRTTTPITIPTSTADYLRGITLAGSGWDSAIIYVDHTGSGITGNTSLNQFSVRDIQIQAATPASNTGHGIHISSYDLGTNMNNPLFERVWVKGFRAGDAFLINQAMGSHWSDILVNDCKNGIHVIGTSYFGKVEFSQIWASDCCFLTDGIGDFLGWTFMTNAPQGGEAYGYYINQNSGDIRFEGNWFEAAGTAGIQTDSSKTHGCYSITNNRWIGNNPSTYGIALNNTTVATITNNNFSACTNDIVVGASNKLFIVGNQHVNVTQSTWFTNNTPANTDIIFQPAATTTTRTGDRIAYAPTYQAGLGLALSTAGGGGTGGLSGYMEFGDGSGWRMRFRNKNATPKTLLDLLDTGAIQGLVTTNGPAGTVTLTASQATSVVSNSAVTASSLIFLAPVTANAAADQGSTSGVWISAKSAGTSFTITHPNNANADKTFNYLLVN